MKKYRCPYCGEPTRRWYHKNRPKATNLLGDFLSVCPSCNHRVFLTVHPFYWIFSLLSDVAIGLSILFLCLQMMLWAKIFFILTVILIIVRIIVSNNFQKFTVDSDDDKQTVWRRAEIVFGPSIHHPKVFLNSTSVVLLRPIITRNVTAAPVRIEPVKPLGEKKYECKLALIQTENQYDSGIKFSIEDDGKVIGQGVLY